MATDTSTNIALSNVAASHTGAASSAVKPADVPAPHAVIASRSRGESRAAAAAAWPADAASGVRSPAGVAPDGSAKNAAAETRGGVTSRLRGLRGRASSPSLLATRRRRSPSGSVRDVAESCSAWIEKLRGGHVARRSRARSLRSSNNRRYQRLERPAMVRDRAKQ